MLWPQRLAGLSLFFFSFAHVSFDKMHGRDFGGRRVGPRARQTFTFLLKAEDFCALCIVTLQFQTCSCCLGALSHRGYL